MAVDGRIGELLDELAPHVATLPPDDLDACVIRVARRNWERATCVPTELAAEIAQAQAESYQAWVEARENDDFAAFRPWLERMVELRLRWAECGTRRDPYDVLLDEFEEGLRTEDVRAIFSVLQPELTALVAEHADADGDDVLSGSFAIDAQDGLSRELVEAMGASWDAFRPRPDGPPLPDQLRAGRHPTDDALRSGRPQRPVHGDARVRPRPVRVGLGPEPEGTLPAGCMSSTLHESQSRLWENVVGRSLPFWRWFLRACSRPSRISSATSRSSASTAP